MILWILRGYTDPDGAFKGGEVTCAVERGDGGYSLLVKYDGQVALNEIHTEISTARGKAGILRGELEKQGWRPANDA